MLRVSIAAPARLLACEGVTALPPVVPGWPVVGGAAAVFWSCAVTCEEPVVAHIECCTLQITIAPTTRRKASAPADQAIQRREGFETESSRARSAPGLDDAEGPSGEGPLRAAGKSDGCAHVLPVPIENPSDAYAYGIADSACSSS